jgi:flagellar biosynthesis/type III secretory pathway protein FliH
MVDPANNVRIPGFLAGVNLERKVESAGFLGEHRRAMIKTAALDGGADARSVEAGRGPADEFYEVTGLEPSGVAAGVAIMQQQQQVQVPVPAPVVDMSRMEAAIDRLQLLSERLAAEARSDALELGLMIARKVVEGELSVNADRLIGVVKSAVRRVGESRRIVVHLSPEDAEMLTGKPANDSAEADKAPVSNAITRLSRGAAKIEVLPDATLSRGDCVVEGDHLSVDATLDTKFAEIRRALLETAWEDHG